MLARRENTTQLQRPNKQTPSDVHTQLCHIFPSALPFSPNTIGPPLAPGKQYHRLGISLVDKLVLSVVSSLLAAAGPRSENTPVEQPRSDFSCLVQLHILLNSYSLDDSVSIPELL